ncbi:hypothetical protein CK203_098955 [Vitis vinifera]|uniref:Reverse transcriptase domain-containing protein n=1 Tax=Vitis vinifera TaxID=29760 RepID=A0A438CV84_VITVI|nr:hypothetical protein CK203_098955 [Vitis vinifera]
MQNALRQNHDVFAWAHSDMKGIHPSITSHRLTSCQQPDPSGRRLDVSPGQTKNYPELIDKLLEAGFIREVDYPDWLANVVVPKKKANGGCASITPTSIMHVQKTVSFATNRSNCDSTAARDALFLGCLLRISPNPHVPAEKKKQLHNHTTSIATESCRSDSKTRRHLSETDDEDLQTSDRPHGRSIY